ncbi:MAG: methyltransferase domain-containing protein [Candidatus Limnocylindria bacterium]
MRDDGAVPTSCCKPDYDAVFDDRAARHDAEGYRRHGPQGSTMRLVNEVTARGVRGASVLDIGGGAGAIGMELLAAGAESLTDVDASRAYIEVARAEIGRRGWAERAAFHYGDFVELADEIDPADVVTLDRVVCCYGDWQALVDRSARHARRLYALVYPNDRWWLRAGIAIGNLWPRLAGRTYRGYVHPERAIDARIRSIGFERRSHHRGWVWQTAVYERA